MPCLDGSSHGFSHGVFDLREELFDRVEIRTVGRQEEEPCACGPNHLPDGLALMRAQVVEHDDIARLKGREKLLFDIGPEGVAVDGAVDHPWRIDPVDAQGGDKGHGLPMAVRHMGDQPLAAVAPAPEWGHVGFDPRFIEENQPRGVNPALIAPPLLAAARQSGPCQLFGGKEGFF